jgi:hypothetical protein
MQTNIIIPETKRVKAVTSAMLMPREPPRKKSRRKTRNNSATSLGEISQSSRRSRSLKKHLKSHYSPARAIQFENDLSTQKYLHNFIALPQN